MSSRWVCPRSPGLLLAEGSGLWAAFNHLRPLMPPFTFIVFAGQSLALGSSCPSCHSGFDSRRQAGGGWTDAYGSARSVPAVCSHRLPLWTGLWSGKYQRTGWSTAAGRLSGECPNPRPGCAACLPKLPGARVSLSFVVYACVCAHISPQAGNEGVKSPPPPLPTVALFLINPR